MELGFQQGSQANMSEHSQFSAETDQKGRTWGIDSDWGMKVGRREGDI